MPSALEDALNLLGAVRERAIDLRTRRRLVLWGGRPGRDVQYRGIEDRMRQDLLARLSPVAQAILAGSGALQELAPRIAAVMVEQHRAIARAGMTARDALEALQAARAKDAARAVEVLARFHAQTRPPSDAVRRPR